MPVQAYLFFDGRCEEAIDFYKRALGAKVEVLMRYRDNPESNADANPGCGAPAGSEDKIMHAELRIDDTTIMVSDGHCGGKPVFQGFGLAITKPDAKSVEKTFGALSESGQVVAPLTPTFFSPSFGMVADRFGVTWMVLAEMATQPA